MEKILIVDDEEDIRLLLSKFFSKKNFDTHAVSTGEEAIAFLKKTKVDLVICDFKLPDYTGLDILQKIKIVNAATQVIIITGYSDVKVAVEALKKGAFDYVTKPLYPDEILMTVENALAKEVSQPLKGPKQQSDSKKKEKSPFVIGPSKESQEVQKHISLIAPTEMSVIILGESGTGKEYVSRSIHSQSKRSEQPFVAVDCGALPKDLASSELFGHVKGAFTGALNDKTGSFERANGGTLFLDEIGNLSYDNQIKLLRVLQERKIKKLGGDKEIPIDVRVIVATNEDLIDAVNKGTFREDIYHRLNEFKIQLSPLRDRPEDIEHFANHFLSEANNQLNKNVESINERCMETLKKYYWHGNLRELRNVIKRSVLLSTSKEIDTSHLPPEITDLKSQVNSESIEVLLHGSMPESLKDVSEEAEKQAIIAVLNQTSNNKSQTAEILNVDRKTLYNKLKQYGIET